MVLHSLVVRHHKYELWSCLEKKIPAKKFGEYFFITFNNEDTFLEFDNIRWLETKREIIFPWFALKQKSFYLRKSFSISRLCWSNGVNIQEGETKSLIQSTRTGNTRCDIQECHQRWFNNPECQHRSGNPSAIRRPNTICGLYPCKCNWSWWRRDERELFNRQRWWFRNPR